ncbi:hypothetical protein OOK60_00995 [Trichothermofontia sichuanensis B231]|uniref:hypothetical protein n=1 Tax=Trichothermofontia sichuanensis TaxID=3045816 RepID=UPI002245EBCA|nr:hypothetical protein [Trichothermofontia sichuanensis]UZQ54688.1 hypothetical protein OOK60_00995 [Trichothermofontia sichuanensis B231]
MNVFPWSVAVPFQDVPVPTFSNVSVLPRDPPLQHQRSLTVSLASEGQINPGLAATSVGYGLSTDRPWIAALAINSKRDAYAIAYAIGAWRTAIDQIEQIQSDNICSGTLSAKMKGACQYILLEEFLYLG